MPTLWYILIDAPARLKKELDTVLSLQGEIDVVQKAIQTAKAALTKSGCSSTSISLVDSLERSHIQLQDKVDVLYTSLNIHESFPELQGINLDFVRTLLMARDLKINIRKRAIGSFFEWEKLDRAVKGRHGALGKFFIQVVHTRYIHSSHRYKIASTDPQSDLPADSCPYEFHTQIQ